MTLTATWRMNRRDTDQYEGLETKAVAIQVRVDGGLIIIYPILQRIQTNVPLTSRV